MPVEKQIAIIYCGTKALLRNIPINKIREFESDFLEILELKHKDVLKLLREGAMNDDISKVLETLASELIVKYKK
jgi:F-type H+-transporting ATPase subunit alpha